MSCTVSVRGRVIGSLAVLLVTSAFASTVFGRESVHFSKSTQPSSPAFVPKLGSGTPLSLDSVLEDFALTGVRDYQIGDEWGKKWVDPSTLSQKDPIFVRAVQATAFFNSATAFYLGCFSGTHVMATNHHVLGSQSECEGRTVHFSLRKAKYRCDEMIGSWPEIDLALFTLKSSNSADADLKSYAGGFDFSGSLDEDTPLLTAGYGIAGNASRQMMVNENNDCRVVSGQNEFRFMDDPDRFNPADYKAWSFATGCSVSHGDSGSAIVNRKSGAVVGLIWTGAIPKDSKIQSSQFIRELQNRDDEEIWSLLTYAVPALKIKDKLNEALISGELSARHKLIVQDILLGPR